MSEELSKAAYSTLEQAAMGGFRWRPVLSVLPAPTAALQYRPYS
jgi:hypothetical protein